MVYELEGLCVGGGAQGDVYESLASERVVERVSYDMDLETTTAHFDVVTLSHRALAQGSRRCEAISERKRNSEPQIAFAFTFECATRLSYNLLTNANESMSHDELVAFEGVDYCVEVLSCGTKFMIEDLVTFVMNILSTLLDKSSTLKITIAA